MEGKPVPVVECPSLAISSDGVEVMGIYRLTEGAKVFELDSIDDADTGGGWVTSLGFASLTSDCNVGNSFLTPDAKVTRGVYPNVFLYALSALG